MISMRQHAVSLIAVFLALAIGVFLGSGYVGDRLNSLTGTDRDRIGKLQDERDSLGDQVNLDNGFIAGVQPRLVNGTLAKRSVLLVTAPSAAQADVQEVRGLINDAGANLTGELALTNELLRDENGAKLATIVDQSIPAGKQLKVEFTDSGARLGDLLGAVLLNKQDEKPVGDAERRTALEALREGGFVTFDGQVGAAQLVLVVTGGELPAESGSQGQLLARLAVALTAHGQGGVLAGQQGSDTGGAAVAVVRADPTLSKVLSTVDDVNLQAGRITSILALSDAAAGRPGAFGTGKGASSITVPAS